MSQIKTITDKTRYQKNGSSFCVIIPPKIREALGLVPRDLLVIVMIDDAMVLRKFELERILSRQEARYLTQVARMEKGESDGSGANAASR